LSSPPRDRGRPTKRAEQLAVQRARTGARRGSRIAFGRLITCGRRCRRNHRSCGGWRHVAQSETFAHVCTTVSSAKGASAKRAKPTRAADATCHTCIYSPVWRFTAPRGRAGPGFCYGRRPLGPRYAGAAWPELHAVHVAPAPAAPPLNGSAGPDRAAQAAASDAANIDHRVAFTISCPRQARRRRSTLTHGTYDRHFHARQRGSRGDGA
jgi:hypothetical protein